MRQVGLALATLSFISGCLFGNDALHNSNDEENYIRHLALQGNEHVLDIGCGNGYFSKVLAESLPQGSVIALDKSPLMIDTAKKTYSMPNLGFRTLNALDLDYSEAFDVAVSFGGLQWISDQKSALRGMHSALKPSGRLFLQIPYELPSELCSALHQTMLKESWQRYFDHNDEFLLGVSDERYAEYLETCGFTIEFMESKVRTHIFKKRSELIGFLIASLPCLDQLPISKKVRFINEVLSQYAIDSSDYIYLPIKRLIVYAKKSA